MKKYPIVIFLIWFLSLNNVFAWDLKTLSDKSWYELYKERVNNFCKEYKNTDESSELIYTFDEGSYFKDLWWKTDWKDLKTAVKEYRKNMDDLYTCATSISFKRQLQLVKNELINKSPKLNSRFRKKLEQKIKEVDQKVKKLKWNCKINTDKVDSLIKKSVLKQSTYELCKYNFYLEYLREYNKYNIKNLWIKEWMAITEASRLSREKQSDIEIEVEKAYRALPIVFQAYSDFENNIWTHILLELLKKDFDLLREWIHRTLNPINQLVYKISNAMRK